MKRTLFLLFVVICGMVSSAQTAFEQKIHELGFTEITRNWSDSAAVEILQPNCAYINIMGIKSMPAKKEVDSLAWMECYDGMGNYFKKRVILNAQGNSSLGFVKKNFAADFCEDEWVGDKTTDFSIGEWVKQDAFHFKAYYTDYFRGIASVGYKLYDQITQDRGKMWTRASEGSIKKPDKKARCYPDGFPCVVYFNGDFYGVFSWQLKKHRKNMNQTKDKAEHIHLDGVLGDEYLWRGTIDWSQFEVRNPKTLYTMGGAKYDGESPEELIDETSAFYDLETDDEKVKANKKLTAQVKKYIVDLSKNHEALTELEISGATKEEMRTAIEELYDVPGMVDYVCFHFAVNNHDGFRKNWQWLTYDGKKWFVAPYDLDGTFGAMHTGKIILPADESIGWNPFSAFPNYGPEYWVCRYYKQDIIDRYLELRDKNIISAENIKSIVRNWYYRIGEHNYSQEWEKWSNSPCIGNLTLNENWSTTENRKNMGTLPTYNDETTYYAGDKCTLDNRVWVATGTTTGVKPYSGELGHHDSLERIENWIDLRVQTGDETYNYGGTGETGSSTLIISNAEWTTLCLPFSYTVPDGLTVYAVNGIDKETNELVLEQITTPEAHKPYLINGPAGVYHLTGIMETPDDLSEDYLVNRLLHGTYETMNAPVDSYVLQNHNGKICFYRVTKDNITLSPNRAYLSLPVETNAHQLNFMDSLPTNIERQKVKMPYAIYQMDGQRSSALRHGVNMLRYENGKVKKVIVK